METDFVKNLFLRAQIGGNINPSEMLLIIKNLIERIETLEKKLDLDSGISYTDLKRLLKSRKGGK